MRQIGPNSHAEFYFLGCNPGYVMTSEGALLIDSPQRGIDALRYAEAIRESGPIRHIVNTEAHGDHVWGNSFFKDVPVVGSSALRREFENTWSGFGGPAGRLDRMKTGEAWLGDPESVWLMEQPDFAPHPPTTTFDDELTIELGEHTIHCLRMPGHTQGQTSVYIPAEGVVFTGDTIFHRCRTWLHDAEPWQWLDALDRLAELDVETIVPGHGEPCGKEYLSVQAQVIHDWLGVIGGFLTAGMTEDEVVAQETDACAEADPYPMAQRLWELRNELTELNIRNLYRQVAARESAMSPG
ncbi:hypothetical protein GCM10009836_45020 [Pseudonocardia ailaonensis]|uniref:Metallo-beta-lactamase domain-containing protein n=1 Tax=Pseudonocardia ailaonensis TaxID=367279 RepID=A0ABN2NA14_9PSEU